MQCPMCGFADPGRANSCPSCGRSFLPAPAVPAADRPKPRLSSGIIRTIVYALAASAAARAFASLCSSYLDAEQERLESGLLRQMLEHKKQVRQAEQESQDET